MKSNDIQIIEADNGSLVPIVNSIYLHSVYNPEKEADQIIEKYAEDINKKNVFLILGLGFGYHVNSLIKKLNTKRATIIVIEPNRDLVSEYIEKFGQPLKFKILNTDNEKILFEIQEFVEILNSKPCIIKHETTFQLEKEFFKKLLTYRADSKMSSYRHLIDSNLSDFLERNDLNGNFDNLCESLVNKEKISSKLGFVALALNELNKNNQRLVK